MGWGMNLLTPFIQDGSGGVTEGSGSPAVSNPLIDAPDPMAWLGFGVFTVIFLFILLLMIRTRVTGPARRRAGAQKAVFEPAGEDADITFDELDFKATSHEDLPEPETEAITEAEDQHDDTGETAWTHPENDEAPPEDTDQLFAQRPSDEKKSRSPFAGLFGGKAKQEEVLSDDVNEHVAPNGHEDHGQLAHTSIDEQPAQNDRPYPDEPSEFSNPVLENFRSLDDDVEARRRQAEFEERERIFEEIRQHNERDAHEQSNELQEERDRAYRTARDEAQREAEFERRKSEAALEQRLRSLASVERKLSEQADTLGAGAQVVHERLNESLEERFAALSAELNQRLEETAATAGAHADTSTNPDVADLADYVGGEISNLRMSVQDAFHSLTKRLDDLSAKSENAASLNAQLADVNRLLTLQSKSIPVAKNIPLAGLVRRILPASHYSFDTTLSTGVKVDCRMKPTGRGAAISIDDNYPTNAFEHYMRARAASGESAQAANEYRHAVLRHIVEVAETLIIPGETAKSAMIFAPSDNIINDLHASFPDLVQDSYRAKVWIVSPTSLMAAMDTISAIAEASTINETSTSNMSAAEDTIAAEIDRLRAYVAKTEDHEPDAPQTETDSDNAHADDQIDPARPAPDDTAGAEEKGGNYHSLSPEEEAFERLEREEALAEASTENESDSTAKRPPFPLR